MAKYRVWFHPSRGSAKYQEFSNQRDAMLTAKRNPTAEKVIYKVTGRGLIKSKETPIQLKKNVSKKKTSYGGFGMSKNPFGFKPMKF